MDLQLQFHLRYDVLLAGDGGGEHSCEEEAKSHEEGEGKLHVGCWWRC